MTTDSLMQEADQTLQPDLDKKYLEEMVGEGKKFSDAEALAKGKFYADQTIEVYKQRMDEMREDILALRKDNASKASLQELMDQLKQQRLDSSDNTLNANNQEKPEINKDEIKALFASEYQAEKAREKAQENLGIVRNKLNEQFGEKYPQVLKQRSTELGLSDEDLTSLARKSPQALLRTLGLDQPKEQESFQTPFKSNQRRDNFAPSSPKPKTWSYWQELKAKDPNLYNDPKIGAQMAQAAVELGDAFCDGDFYVRGLHEK